jgi:heat shock protein HslJ
LKATAIAAWVVTIAGCSSSEERQSAENGATAPVAVSAQINLQGRWRIASIDGRPPAGGRLSPDRVPSLVFSDYHFSGTVGCNHFGGLVLLADRHLAIHSLSSTLVGCHNETGRQELALSKLFFERPEVRMTGADHVRIVSASHSVELERTEVNESALLYGGPEELAGTSWRIVMMNGEEASASPTRRMLRFGDGVWQGLASCATLSGTWRREGDRINVGPRISATEQNCPPKFAAIDASFESLMRSSPRYVVGPNGELLMAGGGHSLSGGRLE